MKTKNRADRTGVVSTSTPASATPASSLSSMLMPLSSKLCDTQTHPMSSWKTFHMPLQKAKQLAHLE